MNKLISHLRHIAARCHYSLPDRHAVYLCYLVRFGRFPDLNNPKTFNEKVNWRKLHQRDPRFTLFSDKITVKAEVAKLTGAEHVIPTLWTGTDPGAIPYQDLKPPYVIKVNHGYGDHIFIRSSEQINRKEISKKLRKLLANPFEYYKREWAYADIHRRIIIEPMLMKSDGTSPEDYKFFVYNGRVHFIQIDHDKGGNYARSHHDRDWKRLPVTIVRPDYPREVKRPARLDKMIELAEKIGSNFDFVSVDLYQMPDHVYFSETTFYPGGGFEKITPTEWENKFSEPWQVPGSSGKERSKIN